MAINLDGSNYFKQFGYLKIDFPQSASHTDYHLNYAVTRHQTFSSADLISKNDTIIYGTLPYQVNPFMVTFKSRGMVRYFITITRVDGKN